MSNNPAITVLLRTQRGAVSGPHSVEIIRQKYVRGELHPEDELQPSNDPRWFKVCRVRGLTCATEAIGDAQTPQPAPPETPTAKRTPALAAPMVAASGAWLSKTGRSIHKSLKLPSSTRGWIDVGLKIVWWVLCVVLFGVFYSLYRNSKKRRVLAQSSDTKQSPLEGT